MSVKEFTMELEIDREVFHDKEAESDYRFRIFSCIPVHYTTELSYSGYSRKTISIQGVSRSLAIGERYDITFEGTYTHDRYGEYYKILEVAPEKLDTMIQQDKFLQAILTVPQMQSLKDAYPDALLVDMILDDKIDVSKTKGIKEKSLAKIKFQVEENASIAILIAKLSDLNLSTNKIDKLMQHFGSSEEVVRILDDDIYNLCQVKYFGFLTVDKVAIERGDNPENEKRISACLFYLLKKDNNEGHTWSIKDNLIMSATEMLNINRGLVEDRIVQLKQFGELYVEGNRIAFPYIRDQELEIYSHLIRIHNSYTSPDKNKVEDKIEAVEISQGFLFTGEQWDAIAEGSQSGGVMVLNGVAGSGKTLTVKGLVDSLGSDYMTAALSGKAVQVLSQRGIHASTIHRMLGFNGGHFAFNEENPLPHGIIVIDEMSMVDVSLLLAVLKATPSGVKLILIGDSGQLPAIGYGDILRDLLLTRVFPTYELTKVHRQAAQSGILSLAKSVREGNQIMPYNSSGKEVYGELQDQTVISYSDKENIPFDVLKIAKSYKANLKSPEDIIDLQVIVPNRDRGNLSVRSMNIELQQVFNDMDKPFLSRGGYDYREGDKIIAVGNTYKLKPFSSLTAYLDKQKTIELTGEEEEEGKTTIYNGTAGIIKTVLDKTVLIQFENTSGLIAISQSGMDKIEMAYAATVHRLQGSGIPDIIFCLDYGAYKLLSRQLVYTALTRASRKGVVLCENNAMFAAIENDASGTRQTFLGDIIMDKSDYT